MVRVISTQWLGDGFDSDGADGIAYDPPPPKPAKRKLKTVITIQIEAPAPERLDSLGAPAEEINEW